MPVTVEEGAGPDLEGEERPDDVRDVTAARFEVAEQRLDAVSLEVPPLGEPLAEELEIARVYERMERQRLGERLSVQWRLDDVPTDAMIPSLTLQPLLENAIYHGIERVARTWKDAAGPSAPCCQPGDWSGPRLIEPPVRFPRP